MIIRIPNFIARFNRLPIGGGDLSVFDGVGRVTVHLFLNSIIINDPQKIQFDSLYYNREDHSLDNLTTKEVDE